MTMSAPEWRAHVAARQGDLLAFDALVRRFQDMVVGYAYSLLGDFQLAEDAAQDAFVQAFLDLKTLQEPHAFPVWLRRIVFKHCDRITRRKTIPTVPLESGVEVPDRQPGPAEAVPQQEAQADVLGAIRDLPEREREATTLFYINGYSLADVGQFLDVPVSTVKNRLHAARTRLRERMMAIVADTLKQHAPDDEFGRRVHKVVEGIREVPWESTWLTYEGSAYACLKTLEPEVTLDYLMGVCGGAFRFFWHRDASPGMCNLLILGETTAQRTFAPFGYGYTYLVDYERRDPAATPERYQRLIVESIDAGRPVIGIGIIGPPEACVVTGYDRGGEVLYGRSYFQVMKGLFPADFEVTESGYFRVENWHGNCYGLIAPGKKSRRPSRRSVLRSSLEWALELARGPRVEVVPTPRSDGESWLHSGLAAYDQLAEEFLRQREQPALELLMFDGIWLLLTTRENAARFLSGFAQDDVPGAEYLARAAEAYTQEAAACRSATEWIPFGPSEQQVLALADTAVQQKLRRIVLDAKEHE
jgi:RNA polymerase sigma factor (sigma-70 family)